MRKIQLISSLLLLLVVLASCKKERSLDNVKIPFDFDWRFALDDHPGAEQPGFDDSEWRVLDVPHDFSIEHPFDSTYATGAGGGYTYSGIGWYRKTFRTDPGFSDKKVSVLFDGVYRNSEVWINGQYLGIRPYGYSSFYYDLTPHLNPAGEENVLAVKVNTSQQPNSRWYTGSGIYRHVWLLARSKLHIDQWGVFARTVDASEDDASINVSVELRNENDTDHLCKVITRLMDTTGKEAGKAGLEVEIKAGQSLEIDQDIRVAKPLLWSVEQPYLYRLEVEVRSGGALTDSYTTSFGIRTFDFDPDKGFFLNGKHVKLKGVNNHHDGGPLGAAVLDYTHKRQLAILKEMGCNALRMSHNPPAPELLAYADSLGLW